MEEVSASVRDSKSTLPTQQAKFLKKQFSYRFFSLFEYGNWIEVYPNVWHFFFPVSTCYSCRVTYDANKRLKWFYKQRRKCFRLRLVVVSYKALLKPTFYYQVSIMKTNALYLPSQREILGLSTDHIARFKTVPKWSKWSWSFYVRINTYWLTERVELSQELHRQNFLTQITVREII